MGATFEGVQIASVPAEYDQAVVGKRLERDCEGARGRPVGRALRGHRRHQGTRGRAVPHDERGRRAHRAGGAVRLDRHRLGGHSPRGAAGAGATASPRLRHLPARARPLRPRENIMSLEEAVRRMTSLAAEQFQIRDRGVIREGRVRRPGGLRSSRGRRHRHLRGAAQLPARHRARDRQRRAGAGPAGTHRQAARPAAARPGPDQALNVRVLLRPPGATVCLPDPATIMIDRADGGQLVVNPPRARLGAHGVGRPGARRWNVLVAATARAMLECLPQLHGGCINYWDAGNWALNDAADPAGPKAGPDHRCPAPARDRPQPRGRPTPTGDGESRRSSRPSPTGPRGRAASRR